MGFFKSFFRSVLKGDFNPANPAFYYRPQVLRDLVHYAPPTSLAAYDVKRWLLRDLAPISREPSTALLQCALDTPSFLPICSAAASLASTSTSALGRSKVAGGGPKSSHEFRLPIMQLVNKAHLWDPCMLRLESTSRHLSCVAFHPGGRLVAAGGCTSNPGGGGLGAGNSNSKSKAKAAVVPIQGLEEAAIDLWDPVTGEPITTLTGHLDSVRYLAFSPDGRLLASASAGERHGRARSVVGHH